MPSRPGEREEERRPRPVRRAVRQPSRGNRPGEREEQRRLPPREPRQRSTDAEAAQLRRRLGVYPLGNRPGEREEARPLRLPSPVPRNREVERQPLPPPLEDPRRERARETRNKPPLHIFPETGVVGDLRTRAAHRHGISADAVRNQRNNTQIKAFAKPFEGSPAGEYFYPGYQFYSEDGPQSFDKGTILLWDKDPEILAHEMAHAYWNDTGKQTPQYADAFNSDFAAWERNAPAVTDPTMNRRIGKPGVSESFPQMARRWYDEEVDMGWYPPDSPNESMEVHGRAVQFSPESMTSDNRYKREDWPPYIQQHFGGFLEGMEPGRNPTARFDMEVPPQVDPASIPDANGFLGSWSNRQLW